LKLAVTLHPGRAVACQQSNPDVPARASVVGNPLVMTGKNPPFRPGIHGISDCNACLFGFFDNRAGFLHRGLGRAPNHFWDFGVQLRFPGIGMLGSGVPIRCAQGEWQTVFRCLAAGAACEPGACMPVWCALVRLTNKQKAPCNDHLSRHWDSRTAQAWPTVWHWPR